MTPSSYSLMSTRILLGVSKSSHEPFPASSLFLGAWCIYNERGLSREERRISIPMVQAKKYLSLKCT